MSLASIGMGFGDFADFVRGCAVIKVVNMIAIMVLGSCQVIVCVITVGSDFGIRVCDGCEPA